jgi:hypothetical protein
MIQLRELMKPPLMVRTGARERKAGIVLKHFWRREFSHQVCMTQALGFLKLADHGYEHRDYNSPRETGSTLCIRMTLTRPAVLARLPR